MPRLALVIVCLLGCVSKAKYEKAADELDACRDEIADAKRASAKRVSTLEDQMAATADELAELRAQREAQAKELEAFRSFIAKLQSMIDVGDITVYVRRGRLMVGMSSRVLFPSGKHELSPKGQQTLEKVATALATISDRRFLVAGHTDNRPIGAKLKEEYDDNWDLSAARALTVTRFLIEHGVPPKSLAATAYNQYDPVRTNRTVGGRRLNRRIEIIVEPNIAQLPKVPDALGAAVEAIAPEE